MNRAYEGREGLTWGRPGAGAKPRLWDLPQFQNKIPHIMRDVNSVLKLGEAGGKPTTPDDALILF